MPWLPPPLRLAQLAARRLERTAGDFANVAGRLQREHPRRRLDEWSQRLDDLQMGLVHSARLGMRGRGVTQQNLTARLVRLRPTQILQERRQQLRLEERRLKELGRHSFRRLRDQFTAMDSRLRLLGPEQVLARGYSITMDAASGKVLRDAAKVKAGQRLKTRLKVGEVRSRAES